MRRSIARVPGTLTLCALLGTGACSDSGGTGPGDSIRLALDPVVTGLTNPLFLTSPPGDPRLFIVEQAGRIVIVEDGALVPTPFLDIRDRVGSGGERGLLSVAFHPDYATNGRFFVDYTDRDGNSRIEEYRVSVDPNVADPGTAALVLGLEQPFSSHNGGQIEFGPDGMLYIAFGDGGGGPDPDNNAQDPGTLLGALLRIDIDGAAPYEVPADNPFVGVGGSRDEIWAYGLRNPWRFAHDGPSGLLYIADVGQSAREEVNVVSGSESGLNFGWKRMEGSTCFGGAACSTEGLTLPTLEYDHDDGCSVTGGRVYRGTLVPELIGHYAYADFCRGWIRSFRVSGGAATNQLEWDVESPGSIVSFGSDADGELYVVSLDGGVFQVVGG